MFTSSITSVRIESVAQQGIPHKIHHSQVVCSPPSMPKLFNRLCEEMLMHWLEGRKTFRLLFESENSSNVLYDFHRCCDRKGPTVSIFFAENSSFGGYTSASWEAKPSGSKPDRDAFVFKLYDRGSFNPRKYDTDDHSCSIYCHPLYGPTFGGGDHAKAKRDIETRLERRSPPGRDMVMIHADLGQTYNSQRHHGHERLVYNSTAQTRFQVYQVLDDKGYLPSPWTQVSDNKDKMIAEIEGFCPPLDHVKILLVGQQGAGKSSYIHSIRSAFRGYVTSAHSTQAMMEHQVRRGRDRAGLGLWFCESQETAPPADSIMTTISLWIQRLFVYIGYRKSAHWQNMQGIVFVIDGSAIDNLPKHIKREFDQWKDIANKYKIPQTVVLTKIDLVCSLADTDLSLMSRSSRIADLVDKTAELMGLPRSHIFPVKNYVEEVELEKEVDRLTLFSLRQMLRFIQDRHIDSLLNSRPEDIV